MRRTLCLSILMILCGCNAGGAIAYKVVGPPDVPAKYVPKPEPMLVFVENYQHPSSAVTDSEILGRFLVSNLKANKIGPLIELEQLREYRAAHAPAQISKLSVAAIGRELGAKQVLYVNIVNNSVELLMGGDALRGQAAVRVKIVDVESGETRWPQDMADGYPIAYATQLGGEGRGDTEMTIKQHVYATIADRTAKLFYKWKPEEMEPEGFIESK